MTFWWIYKGMALLNFPLFSYLVPEINFAKWYILVTSVCLFPKPGKSHERRPTYTTMAIRKRTKGQTTFNKSLHKKLKTEKHKPF